MALPASGVMTLAMIQAEFGGANPISLSEYYKGGAYVTASDVAPNVPTSGAISLSNFRGASKNIVGQIAYTTPGTYTWVVPAGVTSVCVVAVGAGGQSIEYFGPGSASGGSLAYGNNIPVTPGASYTVKVGGTGTDSATTQSYFSSASVLLGGGGTGGGAHGGSYAAQASGGSARTGGGNGGSSGGGGYGGGGGGAGGYSGNGGNGGQSGGSPLPGTNGAGGGGGGGGGGTSGTGPGRGGGGVGVFGQGADGAGGESHFGVGTGGSGGTSGSDLNGGAYGGGSSGTTGQGGGGAVRIIWGAGRSFPSTNTGNL